MPAGIPHTYASFMESVCVFGAYASGVGHMRQRENGIPQGCPWSMCRIALVCSAWVRHTRTQAPQAYIR
eukprot:14219444-Alexandrium_andersonii.AAC.1